MLPLENYLYDTYFGNTILQYLIFFALLGASILIGKIAYYFIKNVLRRVTRRTKITLDDLVLEVVEKPLIFLILIVGFYFGYKQLTLTPDVEDIFAIITKNLVTLAMAWFVVRLVDKVIEFYLSPLVSKTHTDLDDHLVPLLRKIAKYSLIIIGTLIILSNVGINVTSALAGLGIGGLAVALAAQETLKNILGGVAILTDKPFKLGDWVEIDKHQGSVVEIGLRSTRLRTVTGEFVTIPNSIIGSASTVNYLKYSNRKITFVIGLTYDTSAEKIEQAKSILKEILEAADKVVKNSIEINFVNFNSYSLDLDVRFDVHTNKGGVMRSIRDAVNLNIRREFEKAGISIAFPTQTIEMKQHVIPNGPLKPIKKASKTI
jgi:MscS family membrane protein